MSAEGDAPAASAEAAALDPRLNAFRPDLADARLAGQVSAAAFVEGRDAETVAALAPLRAAPDSARSVTATLLLGEPVWEFERRDGWAWVQSQDDGYVGYAPAAAIGASGGWPTHRVLAPRTHLYPAPDLKRPPVGWAPMAAKLRLDPAATETARFRRLAGDAERWVYAAHLAALDRPASDWVAQAEAFLGVPYLWGGDSADGVDCSGLIQTALACRGVACPRDSDLQERALGDAVDPDGALRRGDLVFWKGHVGVMRNDRDLLHANAWAMAVASEPLATARSRIEAQGGGPVTCARRL